MTTPTPYLLPRRSTRVLIALLSVGLLACGGASWSSDPERAFASAVGASVKERWVTTAGAAYAFRAASGEEDPRFDRATLLLAQGLEGLELSHAASLYYLDIAASRRDMTLVDDAVKGLEGLLRAHPHDASVIVSGFLATAEISELGPEEAGFVRYLQGVDSLRRGEFAWALQQFEGIGAGAPNELRARFAIAVALLAHGRFEAGREALELLRDEPALDDDVRVQVRVALARLAMDEERWSDAVALYDEVREHASTQPELLLEIAWAHYQSGDSRRALGFLLALDAPMYEGLIAPERYLLEAFCLRRLCQFEPARVAAVRLRARYGDALRDLRRGVAPTRSEPLRAAARRRGLGRVAAEYTAQLRAERAIVDELGPRRLGDGLHEALVGIYAAGEAEAARREEAVLEDETRTLARELARAEDGVRLVLHDLGVGLLRGRQRPPGPDEVEALLVQAGDDAISYGFAGEFWTDELDDLVVTIEDRCLR